MPQIMRLHGFPPLGDPSFNTLLFAGTVRAQRTYHIQPDLLRIEGEKDRELRLLFLILSVSFKSDFPSSSYIFS